MVTSGGVPVHVYTHKATANLSYLAVECAFSRVELTTILWPGQAESQRPPDDPTECTHLLTRRCAHWLGGPVNRRGLW